MARGVRAAAGGRTRGASRERALRREICEIGRRLYERGFSAANEGNLSARLSDREVLCSPTLICKGFMRPDDLCVVDYDGNQVRGRRKRTSEIFLHLEIYRHDPAAQAVVHCHPPHATAFAVAGVAPPSGIHPEMEVFVGVAPLAPYETPGNAAFAATIRPFVGTSNTVLLANHGTVSWGDSPEQAYWRTEILDAYCRILILARQIGGVVRLPAEKVNELLRLRTAFGMRPDPRLGDPASLYANPDFGRTRPERG